MTAVALKGCKLAMTGGHRVIASCAALCHCEEECSCHCERSEAIYKKGGVVIDKKGYTYILFSKKNGTLYVGVTSDLQKRVAEHKAKIFGGGYSKTRC